MHVTINGETRDVPERPTIHGLIVHLGLTDGPVAVEVNSAIVPRALHKEHRLEPGDILEIVHFVGGG